MENYSIGITEYEYLLKNKGSRIFRTLKNFELIPLRTKPFKIYTHRSGAYAAIFQINLNNNKYALRLFFSPNHSIISRYKIIASYLKNLNVSWKVYFDLLENELMYDSAYLPVLIMEWVDGVPLNAFITSNLTNNSLLNVLQQKIFRLFQSLEDSCVGHGDIQAGNILVTSINNSFELKLIDYDGMYVPGLDGLNSLEKGRSEFQHPKRNLSFYNCKMDRFSFWVVLTALEALKHDKTLWKPVPQGGFNTLDNLLFTFNDFTAPEKSTLFRRLYSINTPALNYYLDKLIQFCNTDINSIEKPSLYAFADEVEIIKEPDEKMQPQSPNEILSPVYNHPITNSQDLYFEIFSNQTNIVVLSSSLKKIGSVPLKLPISEYNGKTIIVTNGKEYKKIILDDKNKVINIIFN